MTIRLHPQSRVFDAHSLPVATPRPAGKGEAWQLVCIDCGGVELQFAPKEMHSWTCAACLRRRATEDKALVDKQGVRRCRRCEKRLTRLNFGPQCYACDIESPVEYDERDRRHIDLAMRQEIMARHAEGARICDLAREYALPESTMRSIAKGHLPVVRADNRERDARIRAEYVAGLVSQARLAAKYGIAKGTVWRILKDGNRGVRERNKHICNEYAGGGISQSKLAEKHGLTRSRVQNILREGK